MDIIIGRKIRIHINAVACRTTLSMRINVLDAKLVASYVTLPNVSNAILMDIGLLMEKDNVNVTKDISKIKMYATSAWLVVYLVQKGNIVTHATLPLILSTKMEYVYANKLIS